MSTKKASGVAKGGGGEAKAIEEDLLGPVKPGKLTEDGTLQSGGVGTLIVRIVAARDLPPAIKGGFFSNGSSNPYCMLEFEGHTQVTSVVKDTLDPIWPREQYFFEVKMPAMHAESEESASMKMGSGAKAMFSSSEPHLHVMLVHKANVEGGGGVAAAESLNSGGGAGARVVSDPSVVVKPKTGQVPSGDVLLGEAFVNVVDLTTARIKNMDQWFHLSDGGAVRLTVEYDVLEAPPQPGELVRLLGFGSATDLWPLPLKEEMLVEGYVDSNHERLLVSYQTSEGWKCNAEVHRFHVISSGRHKSIVNKYQDKILDAAISFMETPLMNAVGNTLDKVCEGESLSEVGKDIWNGVLGVGSRWLNMGLSTAVADVKYAFKPQHEAGQEGDEEEEGEEGAGAIEGRGGGGARVKAGGGLLIKGKKQEEEEGEGEYEYTYIPPEKLSRILCPITGTPMRDPVTAADGHAYEREAIERWLEEHSTSPLTGAKLVTTAIFDCRPMRDTIEEFRSQNEALKAAALIAEGEGAQPGVVVVTGGVEESKSETKVGGNVVGAGAIIVDEEDEGESKRIDLGALRTPPVQALVGESKRDGREEEGGLEEKDQAKRLLVSSSAITSSSSTETQASSTVSSSSTMEEEEEGEKEEKESVAPTPTSAPATTATQAAAAAEGEVSEVLEQIMQNVVDREDNSTGSQ